jgi:transposase
MDKEARADKARFSDLIGLLASIPGVSTLSALSILSEIGADMSRFDTAGHLIAWAGLCPGQNESAGKRKPTRLRKAPLAEDHARPVRLGGQADEQTAITRPSSSVCRPDAARKKPSAPWRLRS